MKEIEEAVKKTLKVCFQQVWLQEQHQATD
jgi:hypothetical protein